MKKFLFLVLVCVLTFSLLGCSMCAQPQATTPATIPSTVPVTPTTTPAPSSVTTMPTTGTNIPDPSVDTSHADLEDIMPSDSSTPDDNTTPTDATTGPAGNADQSRSRMGRP